MLVGCSAGCLYATLIAGGRTTAEAAEMTRVLWTSAIAAQHDRRAVFRAMFPKLLGFDARFGLRDDRLIMQRLRTAFGDSRIEDMQIPLHLTATDFATGNQAVFSSGRAIDAIRASIAVPFLFSPWPIDGRLYLDGYMSDPLPVGVAMREGAEVIVAMGFESPYQEHISTAGRFAFQVSAILSQQPAEVAVLVPRARAPRRDHLDHPAVQAAHKAVRHREDSLHHRRGRARRRRADPVPRPAAVRASHGRGGGAA